MVLYGSYRYRGGLAAKLAVERGVDDLVLAGRNPDKTAAIADRLDAESRVFGVDEAADHLAETAVLLNCTGPFVDTYEPMVEACIETGTHYLDITGEIEVYLGVPSLAATGMQVGSLAAPLLSVPPFEQVLETIVDATVSGPDERTRDEGACYVWGGGQQRRPDSYQSPRNAGRLQPDGRRCSDQRTAGPRGCSDGLPDALDGLRPRVRSRTRRRRGLRRRVRLPAGHGGQKANHNADDAGRSDDEHQFGAAEFSASRTEDVVDK